MRQRVGSAGAVPRVLASIALLATVVSGCGVGVRYATPDRLRRDARFGYLGGTGPTPTRDAVCGRWSQTLGKRDAYAASHVSYPEADPARGCFAPVKHTDEGAHADPPPAGCAYPTVEARADAARLAERMEAAVAETKPSALLPCKLEPAQRAATLRHDARVFRALAAVEAPHAYAAVMVPGFGTSSQGASALAGWLPGDACRSLKPGDDARFRVLAERARRGAQAIKGSVAPVAVVSGGAVHSPVVEAFALLHFLQCKYGVAPERVLLEPCAQHTHENLRNAGRFVVAIGGRAAYLVTDDGIQADYFQDWSGFEMILGSIDQRSLRDWGYLPGSWRQASSGMDAGFWFTPYRFWAEPRDGLGAFTCLDPNAEKW